MPDKKRILILCTGNSARSQMAEGLLRHDAGDRFEVFSAGTRPSRVRPEAIAVMRELGIDISGHRSKSVDEFAGQHFDYVLTVCDNAKESCPIFPAETVTFHPDFEDPAALQGSEDERLALFRRVRDEIQNYLSYFRQSEGQWYRHRLKRRAGKYAKSVSFDITRICYLQVVRDNWIFHYICSLGMASVSPSFIARFLVSSDYRSCCHGKNSPRKFLYQIASKPVRMFHWMPERSMRPLACRYAGPSNRAVRCPVFPPRSIGAAPVKWIPSLTDLHIRIVTSPDLRLPERPGPWRHVSSN